MSIHIIKKAFKSIVMVPNFPIMLILALYVFINIRKHTGIVEMQLMEGEEMLTKDIKSHIFKIYPPQFKYVVAVVFYGWIALTLFRF